MYKCMYTYICIYIYIYIYTNIYKYFMIYIFSHVYTYVHVFVYILEVFCYALSLNREEMCICLYVYTLISGVVCTPAAATVAWPRAHA